MRTGRLSNNNSPASQMRDGSWASLERRSNAVRIRAAAERAQEAVTMPTKNQSPRRAATEKDSCSYAAEDRRLQRLPDNADSS
jgi:hypothetical protein